MSRYSYNSDTFSRLYDIGGADLALRYAEISSSRSAERRLEFTSLRFYEGETYAQDFSRCQYSSRFPKSSTRYVFFLVEMTNPWRSITSTHELVARYYKSDGSLFGETEQTISVRPEWETFWHSGGQGWSTPGFWPPGSYQVEISVDEKYRTTGTFAIFADVMSNPFTTPWSP